MSGLRGLAGLAGIVGGGGAPPPPTDEAEVTAYIAKVVARGGAVSAANRTLLNALISALKADGTLATIQRWYFPAGSNSFAGAMVPLIDTLNLGDFGNTGFTSANWNTAGLKSNTAQYIDSLYNPAVRLANINSVNVTTEITEHVTTNAFPCLWGAKDLSGKSLTLYSSVSPVSSGSEAYDASTTSTNNSSAIGVGTVAVNRSSVNSHLLAFNGSTLANNTVTRTVTPPSLNLFFHAQSQDGEDGAFSASRILSISIGAAQTAGQMATMRTALVAYKSGKGI